MRNLGNKRTFYNNCKPTVQIEKIIQCDSRLIKQQMDLKSRLFSLHAPFFQHCRVAALIKIKYEFEMFVFKYPLEYKHSMFNIMFNISMPYFMFSISTDNNIMYTMLPICQYKAANNDCVYN